MLNSYLSTVLIVLLLGLGSLSSGADDEHLVLDARINGQPVRLAFDTGMGGEFMLFSSAAEKLNLKFSPPDPNTRVGPGQFPVGWTDVQKVQVGDCAAVVGPLAVVDMPPYLNPGFDGIIGWLALSNNVLSLDWSTRTLDIFTNDEKTLGDWTKCRIQTNTDVTLVLPGKDGESEIIALDSGDTHGVKLNPDDWREWEISSAGRPMSFEAYYSPASGLAISKEGWADRIALGTLALTEVPVMQADSSDAALHSAPQSRYVATLGLAAMKRLDIIIDGRRGFAYLRPKKTPPVPYAYNHLAAVFVPHDLQSDDLVAHVIKGGPGYNAGIRDGDVLLKIGHLDCTLWRIDPNVLPLSRFFEAAEGTQLELTLKRGDKVFKTTAVLKNILPPDAATTH